jgi:DNA-binding CsgD family transcriptional regulator
MPLYTSWLLRLRGRIGGEFDDLQRALDLVANTPFAYDRACAQLELGSAIRRAGQRTDAQPLLRAALDYAGRAGAIGLAQRATEELRASGARPRRAALSGVEALTPTEGRIAQLAATGRTNREIAQHLFVTINTVDKHMRAVFRKLDITSRTELARALAATR